MDGNISGMTEKDKTRHFFIVTQILQTLILIVSRYATDPSVVSGREGGIREVTVRIVVCPPPLPQSTDAGLHDVVTDWCPFEGLTAEDDVSVSATAMGEAQRLRTETEINPTLP